MSAVESRVLQCAHYVVGGDCRSEGTHLASLPGRKAKLVCETHAANYGSVVRIGVLTVIWQEITKIEAEVTIDGA